MSVKFSNLLYRYIPAHFKIAPKDVNVFLAEGLDFTVINRDRYLVGSLNPDSTEITYDMGDNVDPFKDNGVVKIQDEYIKYDGKDLINHKLINLERGYFGTEAVAHCNEVLWTAMLEEDLDPYSTTIKFTNITDIGKIPQKGQFAIFSDTDDIEIISYSNYSQWLNGYTFTNVTRGDAGSSAGACYHSKGSFIQEYANLVITQVETVKYDKGLWTADLATAMTDTVTTAVITLKFQAQVASTVINNDKVIYLDNIIGAVPQRGHIIIDDEIIQYGNFIVDDITPTSGRLEQCIRGSQNTLAVGHVITTTAYFQIPINGEFLIDDEYVQYTGYDEITRTLSGLLRGRYGSTAATHAIGATLTERRHTELEAVGVFRIGNEYFKYWYVDDSYFYIDPRPALNSKTYYHTIGNSITSIIEGHDVGAMITTYHFDDENSYLVDFLHAVAEHLDIALNTKIDKFENFSDIDNVDADYIKYIVKQLGENLDDYQNLPFFTGANSDYRIRLFTKELINLYKGKGLLSALKLWHTIISEPLTSYQDLWTFNYCSFYSLPFLALILYEPLRVFYPSNENFFRPQISKALQAELAIFYANKNIRSAYTTGSTSTGIGSIPVPNLKLIVHDWEYFAKTDDDVKSSGGGTFDSKIVSCDSEDNLGIVYDQDNVALQVRDTADSILLPFYVEDYDVDLFKFEEELDATKNIMPDSATSCYPIKTDEGLVSDYDFEWIKDSIQTDIFDYCTVSDRLLPLRTDLEVLRDQTLDSSNAEIELDHNISATDTEIVVKVISGKLYDPNEHIITGTNPNISPKGFIKLGDEIISYTGIQFYDHHEGVFTDKRYKLTGCTRGVNRTTAAAYKVNLYEGVDRLLANNYVSVVYDENSVVCQPITITNINNILTSVNHGLETNDIILFNPRGDYGRAFNGIEGTWSDYAVPKYYYVYKLNADRFQISTIPIIGTVTPVEFSLSGTTDVATDNINSPGHNLLEGDAVYVSGGAGGGISPITLYYVKYVNIDNIQLATIIGGPAINITAAVPVNIFMQAASPICHKISFRLTLTRDPKGFNVSIGDHLQLVQTGYDYSHTITNVLSTYDYCSETYTYAIDFVTGIKPTPTVKTAGAAGLPTLSLATDFTCLIDMDDFKISRTDEDGLIINHDLSDGDMVYFLRSAGNIDAYINYYVADVHNDYFRVAADLNSWGLSVSSIADNMWISASAHGLSNGEIVIFSGTGGDISSGQLYFVSDITTTTMAATTEESTDIITSASHDFAEGDAIYIAGGAAGGLSTSTIYYVKYIDVNTFQVSTTVGGGAVDITEDMTIGISHRTFKLRGITDNEIVLLTAGETNTIQYTCLALVSIKDDTNTYKVSGTRIISAEVGYQHRYSLIQHLMWRLDNEINGNDLPLVYGLTSTQLMEKKLDTYTGLKGGIIWPTPHFKYGFEITTDNLVAFPPNEVVEIVLKKLQQYKPKHTVADLTIAYPVSGQQIGLTAWDENYETENLMSDAYRSFTAVVDYSYSGGSMDSFYAKNHDLHEGSAIYIEHGEDAGFVFGTVYYVHYLDPDNFQVSLSLSGTPPKEVAGAIVVFASGSLTAPVVITDVPVEEYRIELDHDTEDGVIDFSYDLPIITVDVARNYGSSVDFYYTWKDGTVDETSIHYSPFIAYPKGLKTDVWRNRKRALSYIDA